MKKIIALLIAITCVFAMVSCGGNGGETVDVTAFKDAVAATAPTAVEIETALETELGTLEGTFNVTYATDGSAVIEYSYEQFNELGESSNTTEVKNTVSGTVNVGADGSYSDGGALVGSVSAAGGFTINLDTAKMKDCEVNGNVLTATVEAANTEAVLGVAIAYDVNVVLTKGETSLVSLTLTYTTDAGLATVTCEY
ncbi:MAG: hypothetical protein IJX97_04070 [Clostridia bacterium]|nr:hypothetical protein [Clostridia bacterium]MBQ8720082.1 hypothetical protein [Clostridia bacterium]